MTHPPRARRARRASVRGSSRSGRSSRGGGCRCSARASRHAPQTAAAPARHGQRQRSLISIRCAGAGGLAARRSSMVVRHVVLAQADLRQDAEEVRDDHGLRPARSAAAVATTIAAITALRISSPRSMPPAHLARRVRAVGERHLVVGDVDRVDAGEVVGHVERGRSCRAAWPRRRSASSTAGAGASASTAATYAGTQSVSARTWSTHVSCRQARGLGLGHVPGDRVAPVGERRVHVGVLAQQPSAAIMRAPSARARSPRARSARSPASKKRSSR